MPLNARSCKHLRTILGDEYEDARVGVSKPKGAASSKGKRKRDNADNAAAGTSKRNKTENDENEGEEEDDDIDLSKADVLVGGCRRSWMASGKSYRLRRIVGLNVRRILEFIMTGNGS